VILCQTVPNAKTHLTASALSQNPGFFSRLLERSGALILDGESGLFISRDVVARSGVA